MHSNGPLLNGMRWNLSFVLCSLSQSLMANQSLLPESHQLMLLCARSTTERQGGAKAPPSGWEMLSKRQRSLIEFCRKPRSCAQVIDHIGLSHTYAVTKVLQPLIDMGLIKLTPPQRAANIPIMVTIQVVAPSRR